MSFMYKYDHKFEERFGKQVEEMLDMCQTDYYEIWIGTSGYAVSLPDYKVYDSYDGDESALIEATGIGLSELWNLVTMRAGTGYNLNPHFYEEKTGTQDFPYHVLEGTDKTSVVVMVLSIEDVLERIRVGKFVS